MLMVVMRVVVLWVHMAFDSGDNGNRRVCWFGRDGSTRGVVVLLANRVLRSMILIVECRNHAFSTFDLRFLHLHWTMYAMELVIQTASVANGMAVIIATPERSDGRAAVLTSHYNVRCSLSISILSMRVWLGKVRCCGLVR